MKMFQSPWLILAALVIVLHPLPASASDEPASATPVEAATLVAKDAAADGPEAAEDKPAAKPEMICRMEAELGSRVKKKVCRSSAQVEDEARETQDVLRDARSLGNKNFNASPGS